MRFFRHLLAAALALSAFAPLPALPATSTVNQQQVMCQGDVSGATTGTRTIGGTLSAVPSGTIYVLNGQGCALIAIGDVAYFQSQGFTAGANLFSLQFAGITSAASATTQQIGTMPKGGVIIGILLAETAGNSITGGVDIGTTASGTNIVSAQALSANGLITVADSAIALRIVGSSGSTVANPVYVTCHTSCNNGSITVTVFYSFM